MDAGTLSHFQKGRASVEYKQTVNLPTTDFPMRANSAAREPEIQAKWSEQGIYERMLEKRQDAPSYILHDGPPYSSSGNIHIGHALNKILKDVIVKYKAMSGFRAPFVPGYDTHGLPTELAALKALKTSSKDLSALEVRALSKEFALKSIETQKGHFMRLGVFGDWDHPYVTLDPKFEAAQIRVFGDMMQAGYIYKGLKPVYWCSFDTTALAEAEVEYADHTSPSIFVRFPVVDSPNPAIKAMVGDLSLAIWTTTPWTLPANLAVALGPDFDYGVYQVEGHGRILMATALAEDVLATAGLTGIPFEGMTFKGRDLEGTTYQHPFLDRKSPVILGDHVTLDAGTGAVHTAPGHGLEDYQVGLKYGLQVLAPLNDRGIFTAEAGPLVEGMPYFKANPTIIEALRERGVLLHHKDFQHSYPHCWRCHNPVIYRATEQWFASIDAFRQATLDAIKGVKWLPGFGEVRISNMVADRGDWCISRQRSWGVPIPVFYCAHDHEPLLTPETIDRVAAKFEAEGSDAWWKYDAADFLGQDFACSKCGGRAFTQERDVMDVWFDSGTTWSAVLEARPELSFPADLYLEGADQYRGWFQSSLLTAIATRGQAPYRMVLTHGFTMDAQGRKMSKSLGNTIEPVKVIQQYGADVLRLYVSSVDYTSDVRISDLSFKQLSEVYRKIRNTARYLMANLNDFDPKDAVAYDALPEIDRYALHRLHQVTQEVTANFESFQFFQFFQTIQNYAVVDLSSFYLDVAKDRLYAEAPDALSRRAAQTVMHEILQAMMRMVAPVLSHLAEDIFTYLPAAQKPDAASVFLLDWPKIPDQYRNEALAERWERILTLREIVNKGLEEARQAKVIGSGLDAHVTLSPKTREARELIEGLGDDLTKVLIVSGVTIADAAAAEAPEGDLGVTVERASGEKCERCWTYSVEVGTHHAHQTLCTRCVGVVGGLVSHG
jgi:isoleucyl-tRNA synthetase